MSLKFGTSGVRGLVTEMTDRDCYLYTKAFIQHLKSKKKTASMALAGDLRKSTPGIEKAVAFAVMEEGLEIDNCGYIPTGALTYYGMEKNIASIMVTGSHIPDDRNGIKFNMPWGEILKDDEAQIIKRYKKLKKASSWKLTFDDAGNFNEGTMIDLGKINAEAKDHYTKRFIRFFPPNSLAGLKIVLYEHSSVGRDILKKIFKSLGAEVISVGRSDKFIPVDTEAVENEKELAKWVLEHKADALVSADGDTDRPLVVDEKGNVIRGDVLGIIVSNFLKADSISTPVSCNTALEKSLNFKHISRTRIGSPYVISAMKEAIESGHKIVVGYEANGGYLTGTDIVSDDTGEVLKALPTRDAALPIIAILIHSKNRGKTLSELVGGLPPRYTASGLIRDFPSDISAEIMESFSRNGSDEVDKFFLKTFGPLDSLDLTDGARILFSKGDIVHLRPSGNAPEFRCYTESSTEDEALLNNKKAIRIIKESMMP